MMWCPEALAAFLVRVPGVVPGPQGTAACFHQLHRDCLRAQFLVTVWAKGRPLSIKYDRHRLLRQSIITKCAQVCNFTVFYSIKKIRSLDVTQHGFLILIGESK